MNKAKIALLDTNILVYLSKPKSEFFQPASKLVLDLRNKGYSLAVSSFAVAEYYSYTDKFELSIEELFVRGEIIELPFGRREAVVFAELRRNRQLAIMPIDAVHVATALAAQAVYLVSNDQKLLRLKIPKLKMKGLK